MAQGHNSQILHASLRNRNVHTKSRTRMTKSVRMVAERATSTGTGTPRTQSKQWSQCRAEPQEKLIDKVGGRILPRRASRSIVYEDEHEKETSQSDGETVKNVMINEGSSLLSTASNLKSITKGIRLGENKYRVTRTDDKRQSA